MTRVWRVRERKCIRRVPQLQLLIALVLLRRKADGIVALPPEPERNCWLYSRRLVGVFVRTMHPQRHAFILSVVSNFLYSPPPIIVPLQFLLMKRRTGWDEAIRATSRGRFYHSVSFVIHRESPIIMDHASGFTSKSSSSNFFFLTSFGRVEGVCWPSRVEGASCPICFSFFSFFFEVYVETTVFISFNSISWMRERE